MFDNIYQYIMIEIEMQIVHASKTCFTIHQMRQMNFFIQVLTLAVMAKWFHLNRKIINN